MNPYQIMGIIAGGTIIFAGVVTFLTMQGVHILLAFLGVYLVAVILMIGMQRSARENFELMEDLRLRKYKSDSLTDRSRANGVHKLGQFSIHS